MSDNRITVWVQRFKDPHTLILQWTDPPTAKPKSQSAKTADPDMAEQARADLEYELNHGLHKDAARMSWEKFRDLFEAEYAAGTRPNTQENYAKAFDLFEQFCWPTVLRSITARTI